MAHRLKHIFLNISKIYAHELFCSNSTLISSLTLIDFRLNLKNDFLVDCCLQEVTDFKFEQLSHVRSKGGNLPNNLSSSRLNNGNGNAESDSSNGAEDAGSPFTVLKKADVELMVGGKPKTYSVVIKVLPTDDKVKMGLLREERGER